MRQNKRTDNAQRNKTIFAFWRSVSLALASFIAIVMVCLAWFINNQRVSTEAMAISTQADRLYLATLVQSSTHPGVYDNLDTVPVWIKDKSELATLTEKILSFVKGTRELTIGDNTYLLGDSDNISLMVSPESNLSNDSESQQLSPGSSGKLEFYIISNADALDTIRVSLKLEGYQLADPTLVNGAYQTTMSQVDDVTEGLLNGHLLFFQTQSQDGYYSGWLTPTASADGITMDLELSGLVKGEPKKVTVYWLWPQKFQDILYPRSYTATGNPIFAATGDDYTTLIAHINGNNEKYAYPYSNPLPTVTDCGVGMSNTDLTAWNSGYNSADQRIGTTVAYLRLKIAAEEITSAP